MRPADAFPAAGSASAETARFTDPAASAELAGPRRVLRGRLREKLPEILIEAASVVFAVLLALAVDEWKDTRAKHELALRAQASVVAEVRGNLAELQGSMRSNRQVLLSIQRQAAAADGAAASRVDINLAQLSAAAWQTAQATQASESMDYDWMLRAARLYDLQALYGQSQTAVLDALAQVDPASKPSVRRLQTRLAMQQQLGAGLRDAYGEMLAHSPPDPTKP